MSLNTADIRKDFPILDQVVNGRSLIYFDNAATAQRPVPVIEKVDEFSFVNSFVHAIAIKHK